MNHVQQEMDEEYDLDYLRELQSAIPIYVKWNKDRRMMSLITKFILDFPDRSRMIALDLGSGFNRLSWLLTDKGWRVVSVDSSERLLKWLGKEQFANIHNLEGYATALPIKSGSIKVVILNSFFEHLSFPQARVCLDEVIRALVPKGLVILYLPSKSTAGKFLRFIKSCFLLSSQESVDDTGDITHRVWYTYDSLINSFPSDLTLYSRYFYVYGRYGFPTFLRHLLTPVQKLFDVIGLSKMPFLGRHLSLRMIVAFVRDRGK